MGYRHTKYDKVLKKVKRLSIGESGPVPVGGDKILAQLIVEGRMKIVYGDNWKTHRLVRGAKP